MLSKAFQKILLYSDKDSVDALKTKEIIIVTYVLYIMVVYTYIYTPQCVGTFHPSILKRAHSLTLFPTAVWLFYIYIYTPLGQAVELTSVVNMAIG